MAYIAAAFNTHQHPPDYSMHGDTHELDDWSDQKSVLRVARAIDLSYSMLGCIVLALSSQRALAHIPRDPTVTRTCRLEADAGHLAITSLADRQEPMPESSPL